jgi:hypothetical protein
VTVRPSLLPGEAAFRTEGVPGPDTATAGDPFTVAESLANATARSKLVRVTQTLAGPSGTLLSFSYPFFVPTLTLRANTASAAAATVVS